MPKEGVWSITDIRRATQTILAEALNAAYVSFTIRSLLSENDKIITEGEHHYFLQGGKFKIVLKASDLSLISVTTQ